MFLIGLMGTGKSTVGPLLAARLERRFVDLDEMIEKAADATVAEIFAAEGQAGFRRRESEALKDAAGMAEAVVSTGGGAPTEAANLELMLRAGIVVCLGATPEEIVARIGDPSTRPLLAGGRDVSSELRRLLKERQQAYGRAHLTVETTGLAPSQVAARITEFLLRWPGR